MKPFLTASLFFISFHSNAWNVVIPPKNNPEGIQSQMMISVTTSSAILMECIKNKLFLEYLVIDDRSMIKPNYSYGNIDFLIDDYRIKTSGVLFRHDVNFIGLKISDDTVITDFINHVMHAKKGWVLHDNGSHYTPYRFEISNPRSSLNKFGKPCGFKY